MNPIVVLTHVDGADVGLVEEIARERGHKARLVRHYRGEDLPSFDEAGAVVVLGGPQSATDEHAFLRDEERYLAAAVGAEVPVLAICLGSQLLARALGGSSGPGETGLEAGLITVKPAAGAEPGIAGEYFSFHSDSMEPPAGAEILARSDRYPQAWAFGSALAVQFHPEITLPGVETLLGLEGPKLEQFGIDVAALRADAERYFADGAEDSRTLLNRWFDLFAHPTTRD